MLDYDGVLAPIVRHPNHSRILPATRMLLRTVAQSAPTVIVSGRSARDVAHRVRISTIRYVGSHGMELAYCGILRKRRVGADALRKFGTVRAVLMRCARRFPELVTSDKYCSFAVNYRALRTTSVKDCKREIRSALKPFVDTVRIIDTLMTVEIMPIGAWTKGDAALHEYARISRRMRRKPIPIYIGDGITDEDAFKALKSGITIRVGKNSASKAKYFFARRSEVDRFLRMCGQERTRTSNGLLR